MKDVAQGFVEVSSYVASIEAADAMAKAADVVVRRVHKVDGPILCIVCEGDVAACKAAVDAASSLCSAKGTLLAANVIPRPEGGGQLLYDCLDGIEAKKAAKKKARLAARKAACAPTPGKAASAAPAPAKTAAAGKSAKNSRKAAPKNARPRNVKVVHEIAHKAGKGEARETECTDGPCCLLAEKPKNKPGN